MEFRASVEIDCGEAGLTAYMCENEHYDIALRVGNDGYEAVLKLNIGGIKHVQAVLPLDAPRAQLVIRSDHFHYNFFVLTQDGEHRLGSGQAKYLTSEVSGGFTGVVMALYSVGENAARFTKFCCKYAEE